jgi:hypothetical protein
MILRLHLESLALATQRLPHSNSSYLTETCDLDRNVTLEFNRNSASAGLEHSSLSFSSSSKSWPQLGHTSSSSTASVPSRGEDRQDCGHRQQQAPPSAFRSIHDVATSINSHVTSSQSEPPTIPEFSDPWGLPVSRTLSAPSMVP